MASRERKTMSGELFQRLIRACATQHVSIANQDAGRYITRLSEQDSLLMARAETFALRLSRHQTLVRVVHEERTFVCVSGFPLLHHLPSGLIQSEITPGLFALSVLEGNLYPRRTVSPHEVKDAIEGFHMGTPGYSGHELSVISSFFPAIDIYECVLPEDYLTDNFRTAGAIWAAGYEDGPIDLSKATLEKFASLFATGSIYVPYRNLVQAAASISWENLFLELYRCVEQLYSEPHMRALQAELPAAMSLRAVAALLERHLAWRPKEDESLRMILADCGDACIQGVCDAFAVAGETYKEQDRFAARKIYDLRNALVHYRPAREAISRDDGQWNLIISAMLDVVRQAYEVRGQNFFEPQVRE